MRITPKVAGSRQNMDVTIHPKEKRCKEVRSKPNPAKQKCVQKKMYVYNLHVHLQNFPMPPKVHQIICLFPKKNYKEKRTKSLVSTLPTLNLRRCLTTLASGAVAEALDEPHPIRPYNGRKLPLGRYGLVEVFLLRKIGPKFRRFRNPGSKRM